jgi:amino acid transporter
VARLFTYGATCAALLVFRKKPPEEEALHLPVGPLFASLGILFCLALITRMGMGEFWIMLATAVVAFLNWAWVKSRPQRGA